MGKQQKNLIFIWAGFVLLLGITGACLPEEERLNPDFDGQLIFSADTIWFDTLFVNQGSTTQRLFVKNPTSHAIMLEEISLGGGASSNYSLIVNGVDDFHVRQQRILGRDSLLILVKVSINPRDENLPFIVKDSIRFSTNNRMQDVKLKAWGQDAVFLGDQVLSCETVFNNQKPYVIYKSVLVDSLCRLEIEKGARIYFERDAALFIRGSLQATGSPDKPVHFGSVRPETRFLNTPGQWTGIYFLEGSRDNFIEHAIIRNAQTGIRIGTPDTDTIPDLIIRNSTIENMSLAGVLSFSSDIVLENVVISHISNFTIAMIGGGYGRIDHCTFAFPSPGQIRQNPMSVFTDIIYLDNGNTIVETLQLEMTNSIMYGNAREEINFDVGNAPQSSLLLSHNLLKTEIAELGINNNILNENPRFVNSAAYNFRIDSISPARNAGFFNGTSTDIIGRTRRNPPDLGAYEWQPKPQ
ncbi:MAG: right-handed parallel beta-helix repeat-containing protein [Cyclobacteriaceae bacterium]|nr:right-handed parallel beta-helix repeat-containing protein [Cyclobacteriaceae bacterium]